MASSHSWLCFVLTAYTLHTLQVAYSVQFSGSYYIHTAVQPRQRWISEPFVTSGKKPQAPCPLAVTLPPTPGPLSASTELSFLAISQEWNIHYRVLCDRLLSHSVLPRVTHAVARANDSVLPHSLPPSGFCLFVIC